MTYADFFSLVRGSRIFSNIFRLSPCSALTGQRIGSILVIYLFKLAPISLRRRRTLAKIAAIKIRLTEQPKRRSTVQMNARFILGKFVNARECMAKENSRLDANAKTRS